MRVRFWRKPEQTFSSEFTPVDWLVKAMSLTGGSTPPNVGRIEALSVPAVQRGRNLICSVATLPLIQRGPDNEVAPSALLRQLDLDVPNVVTISQTLDDLLFSGIAWWYVTRPDSYGFPVSIRHLDVTSVTVQPPSDGRRQAPLPSGIDPRDGIVYVDGKPVSASQVIRFDSPNPGLLQVGGRAITRAILLDRAANMYAENPRPLDFFTPVNGADPATDEDALNLLQAWTNARKTGSTAWIPSAVEYHSVDSPSPSDLQLVELQKQVTLEIANAMGVDPEDLGISTTSRTYANDVDRRRNKLNEVLAPYMKAITDRLSMGDVTRRGYTVQFDTTEYLQPNPSERASTYKTYLDMGVVTREEIREKEGMPPLPEDAEPAPIPSAPAQVTEPVDAITDSVTAFAAEPLRFADVPVTSFSVDAEGRTIEGIALPYGKIGVKNGQNFKFQTGALQWSDIGRVKLLKNHSFEQALGRAIELDDTPAGLRVKFKVARGAEGDAALALAEDGVLDGLSVGVDFDMEADTTTDPRTKNVVLVTRADLREVSLTPMPAFDDARVTSVAASREEGEGRVPDTDITESGTPVPDHDKTFFVGGANTLDEAKKIVEELRMMQNHAEPEVPAVVNPTRSPVSFVNEALPYRFARTSNPNMPFHSVAGPHEFSADIIQMVERGDKYGKFTDEGKRVMGFLTQVFNTIDTTDAASLNPTIQTSTYIDLQPFRYPLWNAISRGAPPNGVQPFSYVKASTESIVVSGHSEGVEPPRGNKTWTTATVTPSAFSSKVTITREVWDMGGTPNASNDIFNTMLREWFEGLEAATAVFLNTLTAATDVNLGVATTGSTLANNWDMAVADEQFNRGYDLSVLALEKWLYRAFAAAADSTGRKLYPQINPQNANGQANARFTQLDLAGVVGIPSWGLTTGIAVSGSANNSWWFDPEFVVGLATAPQRLEFAGTGVTAGTYAPVAMVDLALWGYQAIYNTDIGGVRQVIYDNAT